MDNYQQYIYEWIHKMLVRTYIGRKKKYKTNRCSFAVFMLFFFFFVILSKVIVVPLILEEHVFI